MGLFKRFTKVFSKTGFIKASQVSGQVKSTDFLDNVTGYSVFERFWESTSKITGLIVNLYLIVFHCLYSIGKVRLQKALVSVYECRCRFRHFSSRIVELSLCSWPYISLTMFKLHALGHGTKGYRWRHDYHHSYIRRLRPKLIIS